MRYIISLLNIDRHITSEGTGFCPECNHAANIEQLIRGLEFDKSCPMCSIELDSSQLTIVN